MAQIKATRDAFVGAARAGSRLGWIVAGGIVGAVAASSCCILPLVLFSLGVSGAWIGQLTALAPYKPYFIAGTLCLLGYGYYLVHVRSRTACADGSCARSQPNQLVSLSLWGATALVIAAFSFDYVAPLLLN